MDNQSSKYYVKTENMRLATKKRRGREMKVPTQTIYFDVDGTLVLYGEDLPKFKGDMKDHPKAKLFYFELMDMKLWLVPHEKHIQELKKYWEKGYEIVVWSRGSKEWAQCVVKHLSIQKYVDIITSKPDIIFDDLPATEWMGLRNFLSYEE